MKDTMDMLADIQGYFIADSVLPGIIGITDTTDMTQCDAKFRQSFADSTLITADELNFLDFSFIISNSETSNYLVNKEMLELNIYASNLYQATLIYKEVKRIFNDKYPEMHRTNPCQAGCPVAGIVRYMFRAKPLVGS